MTRWMKAAKTIPLLLMIPLLLGCGTQTAEKTEKSILPAAWQETVPDDGDPDSVTCKGSYTETRIDADAVAATVGSTGLTNGQLQVWYWMEAAAYRQAGHETAPDFDRPLDSQPCPIDETVNSWQQYFLKQALTSWHSAQALEIASREVRYVTEEGFEPLNELHGRYLNDSMPAIRYLYGRGRGYTPNEIHQEYLDSLPKALEQLAREKGYPDAEALAQAIGASRESLEAYAYLYNYGYMYFTELTWDLELSGMDVVDYYWENRYAYWEAGLLTDSGEAVDLRQVLLIPENAEVSADGTVICSEEDWEACITAAQALLTQWEKDGSKESDFAQLAYTRSSDQGSRLSGGLYSGLRQGQLVEALDSWCFDEEREADDTAVLRTDRGVHILYLSGIEKIWYLQAGEDLSAQITAQMVGELREKYPMTVDYAAIGLGTAENLDAASPEELLYPDVAFQRFTDVPLYLQQDYPQVYYGMYPVSSHGCGISDLAMLATYVNDRVITPKDLAKPYAMYSTSGGTATHFWDQVPQEFGVFVKDKLSFWPDAEPALAEGYRIVSLQGKGYWTQGGHYILLNGLTEDGLVVVRDSSIYNYSVLPGHDIDAHAPKTFVNGGMFWVIENKLVEHPACQRCAGDQPLEDGMFREGYTCGKCTAALLRRSNYLSLNH